MSPALDPSAAPASGADLALRRALRLYLVTDSASFEHPDAWARLEQALQGGVGCVQLREKALDTRRFVERARALKALLLRHRVPLFINDRLDVALAVDADGLHLGQSDMPAALARRWLGPERWIGLSVETPEQLRLAAAEPIDYVALSPLFATPSKTDTGRPWGLDELRAARSQTRAPLVVIGGLDADNAAAAVAAGADGVAVVRAVLAQADPRAAAQRLCQAMAPAWAPAPVLKSPKEAP